MSSALCRGCGCVVDVVMTRESAAVDQRSGVSARFAIAGTESVAASALRRSARAGETAAVARVCDVPTVVPTLLGKVEFEMGEEGREREVLDLVAAGVRNQEIADRLFLSPKTVANHISSIFVKLEVADRSAAIVRARQGGLGGS